MALIEPGGTGRFVYGYTEEQVNKLISQGRLNTNDVVFLEEDDGILTHNKVYGQGGTSDDVIPELDKIIQKTELLMTKSV